MKNYWIKVKGQWRIVGDTTKLQELLDTTSGDLTKLTGRVYTNEKAIETINESLGTINEFLGTTGDSETSITQQIQDLSGDITKLQDQDKVTIAKDVAQDADILKLQQTLGLVDDNGNPVKPTDKTAIDELTECCNENKETIQQVKTTADETKAKVDILTDPDNINSVANQLKSATDKLESSINAVDGKVDALETRHDAEIDRLETVVGLTVDSSGNVVSSKFDDIKVEQAAQDGRLDALEDALGLGGEGSGTGGSIASQVTELTTDVTDIKKTLYDETTGHVKRIADLEAKDTAQDSDLENIKDILGITEGTDGNPVSEVLQNAAKCCEDNKAAIEQNTKDIAANKTAQEENKAAIDKLNDPEDPAGIANQLKTVKEGLEASIAENANAISDLEDVLEIVEGEDGTITSERLDRTDKCCADNAAAIAKLNSADDPDGIAKKLDAVKSELETNISTSTEAVRTDLGKDIAALQEKDKTHDEDITKLKDKLGIGAEGEDTSLSSQVSTLKSQVKDIQDDIGEWSGEKTISQTISDLDTCCSESKASIEEIQQGIGSWEGDRTMADVIGTVPENKTVVDMINDNASAITEIQGDIGDWDAKHPEETITQVVDKLSTCCEDSKNRLDEIEADLGTINLGEGVTIGDAIKNINDTMGSVPEGQNLQGQIDAINALVGTVSGEIESTHEERLGDLQKQADATDTTVAGLSTSITTLENSYNTQVADFETRITANKNAIESNDTDIKALQDKDVELDKTDAELLDAVNARIKMEGSRGSLKGFENVHKKLVTATDVTNIGIDSDDTWYIEATGVTTKLTFTPGDVENCSVKVITIKNTVATALSVGDGTGFTPAWANNNIQPEWGTLANQLLILIAHFIGGTVVLTVFHNSEA